MQVELRYFDGCPNWQETEHRLRQALVAVDRADVAVHRVLVSTPEEAEKIQFRGSPTIVVDGHDPFADPDAPVGLSCRLYRTEEGVAGAPTLEQLREILR